MNERVDYELLLRFVRVKRMIEILLLWLIVMRFQIDIHKFRLYLNVISISRWVAKEVRIRRSEFITCTIRIAIMISAIR